MISRRGTIALAILVSAGFGASSAVAATPEVIAVIEAKREAIERRIEDVERDIERNRADDDRLRTRGSMLEEEIRDLRTGLVAASEGILSTEREIARLKAQIAGLSERQAEMRDRLADRQPSTARVLMALQRVARLPPGAIIAQPLRPVDVVRSGIVLGTVVDELARQAETARNEHERMAAATNDAIDRRRRLAAAVVELQTEHDQLARLLDESAELRRRLAADARAAGDEAGGLVLEAEELKLLLAGLDETEERTLRLSRVDPKSLRHRTPELDTGGSVALDGAAAFPVAGRVVLEFGEAPVDGTASKGVRVETEPGAPVLAPAAGRVAFAGPFRGYGQLLIVEHGHGYHSLMAGLARIDLEIDQHVVAGEPVGVMGDTGDRSPTLYIELRRDGQPVNPLPWLAQDKRKASG